MTDYVVYHKKEKMGYPALEVNNLQAYTNKEIAYAADSRIWLIAGEGVPRKYFLRATFRMKDVVPSKNPKFATLVVGSHGSLFDPMPELSIETWFDEFKNQQGNFAFGLNRISDSKVVSALNSIAHSSVLS